MPMVVTKFIVSMLTNAGLAVKSHSEWQEAEDGDIALANGYNVQVGTTYLCLLKYSYDHDGEVQSVRFILEDATVEDIIKYFKDKED